MRILGWKLEAGSWKLESLTLNRFYFQLQTSSS